MYKAMASGSQWMVVGYGTFCAAMVILYCASTLFHSTRGPSKKLWAKVDHCAIYLLIAGTFTPFALVTLRGTLGWAAFAIVWAIAVAGIINELRLGSSGKPSLKLYIFLGWLGLTAAILLLSRFPGQGWLGLVIGGMIYTLGIPFYLMSRQWRHAHGVWHLFVLAGTGTHYFTVLKLVG